MSRTTPLTPSPNQEPRGMFGMVLWMTESIVGHRCSLLVTIEHGDPLPKTIPTGVVVQWGIGRSLRFSTFSR